MAFVADESDDRDAGGGEQDPGLAADSRLVIRAEQALLGAVLSDPRQAAILDLVRPGDMLRPYHGQVLAAMQRVRAVGAAPDPLRVRAELANDPDLPPRLALDGVLLAGLMEAAPRVGHARAYTAMVMEHGIRKQVSLAGSYLVQAAEAGDLETARTIASWASREVSHCQERWDALPGQVRREVPTPARNRASQAEEAAWQLQAARDEIDRARQDASSGRTRDLEERLVGIARRVAAAAVASQPSGGARVSAPGDGRPRGPAAVAAGERVLRDLAAGPAQIGAVRSWLQPAHFARPARGQLYALMRDMHHAGMMVDPVTIAWEAIRHGIPADPADLGGGTAHFAVASAHEVRRFGLLAQIAQAGRGIGAAAGNPRTTVGQLLRESVHRLGELEGEPGRAQEAARPRAAARGVAARGVSRRQATGSEPSSEPAA
jgi:replicative DNA helicase